MNDHEAVKVLIVNDDGQYLAGTGTDWEFTDDRSRAAVFDYWADQVAERIELSAKRTARCGSRLDWTRGKSMNSVIGAGAGCELSGRISTASTSSAVIAERAILAPIPSLRKPECG